MSKFCPKCGEKLVDSARFCKNCGASLEGIPNLRQTTAGEYRVPVEKLAKRKEARQVRDDCGCGPMDHIIFIVVGV